MRTTSLWRIIMNIFILLKTDDYRTDMGDDHDLVADIGSDTLIRIVSWAR